MCVNRKINTKCANISGGNIYGGLHSPADWVLYREDDTYYLKDVRKGGIITSNTDASTVFNYATSSNGGVHIYDISILF